MQKTLLTALQCISETIQFNREHEQVKNKKVYAQERKFVQCTHLYVQYV